MLFCCINASRLDVIILEAPTDAAALVAPSLMSRSGEDQRKCWHQLHSPWWSSQHFSPSLALCFLVLSLAHSLLQLLLQLFLSINCLSFPLPPLPILSLAYFPPHLFFWNYLLSLLFAFVLPVIMYSICQSSFFPFSVFCSSHSHFHTHTSLSLFLYCLIFTTHILIVIPQAISLTVQTGSLILWMEGRSVCWAGREILPDLDWLYIFMYIFTQQQKQGLFWIL